MIMIDGALARPFFTRNKENQIIGGDSSAQWHSETKGVLMIDDYHKKMDAKQEEMEIIKEEEDEEEDKFDYENEEELEYAYQRELFIKPTVKSIPPFSVLCLIISSCSLTVIFFNKI